MTDDARRHVFVGMDELTGAAGCFGQATHQPLGHRRAHAHGEDAATGTLGFPNEFFDIPRFAIGHQQNVQRLTLALLVGQLQRRANLGAAQVGVQPGGQHTGLRQTPIIGGMQPTEKGARLAAKGDEIKAIRRLQPIENRQQRIAGLGDGVAGHRAGTVGDQHAVPPASVGMA